MPRTIRILAVALCAAAVSLAAGNADAQRGRPRGRPPAVRGGVVFVGGYFYDPFYGPYPWWPAGAYAYPYYPLYDNRAEVRVLVTPKEAAVYVDGFYAGVVDDFNGFFQRLPLPPGGHDIVTYYEGYRTVHNRMYLEPDSTFKLEYAMEKLLPGQQSEVPSIAPPVPPPPVDTFTRPRPPRADIPPASVQAEPPPTASLGTLTLRVQPAGGEVLLDGERWVSSDGARFVVQLTAGLHRVEVARRGYERFVTDVQVREGENIPVNVSLVESAR